jgi:hypothetical protein
MAINWVRHNKVGDGIYHIFFDTDAKRCSFDFGGDEETESNIYISRPGSDQLDGMVTVDKDGVFFRMPTPKSQYQFLFIEHAKYEEMQLQIAENEVYDEATANRITREFEGEMNHSAHNITTSVDQLFHNLIPTDGQKYTIALAIANYFQKRIKELL